MKATDFSIEFGDPPNGRVVRLRVVPTLKEVRKGMSKKTMAYTEAHPAGEGPVATIVLAATQLCVNLIAHESVHAAYAMGRIGANLWERQVEHDEEERIAYPTGEVAAAVGRVLLDAGYTLKW